MLSYTDGRLHLSGVSVEWLAGELGTPVFLFSEPALRENFAAIARGLAAGGSPAAIRYCARANRELAILRLLADAGGELLACHPAEARLALRAGFPPERIAYQRPALTVDEVQALLRAGIDRFYAGQPADLECLEQAAAGRPVRVSLRRRSDLAWLPLSPLTLPARRLGFSRSELLEAAARVGRSPQLRLWGLHADLGTQRESFRPYRWLLGELVALAARLEREAGVRLEELSVGGGFPSRDVGRRGLSGWWEWLRTGEERRRGRISAEAVARQVAAGYRRLSQGRLRRPPRLIAEPGRAIVGGAGVLVTTVRAVRDGWLFLDASRQVLPESPLRFSRRILPLAAPAAGQPVGRYHLAGASQETLDVLGIGCRLPLLRPGDRLVLADAGAYSLSRATRAAGLSPPAYLLGADRSLRQIRRAEGLADLLGPMEPGEPSGGGA